MVIDEIKEEMICDKIDELNDKVENGDDLSQWESVLLDTLEWIALGDEDSVPTFI